MDDQTPAMTVRTFTTIAILFCGIFLILVLIFLWSLLPTQQSQHSDEIPYVTDSAAYREYIAHELETRGAHAVQEHIRTLYADESYSAQHMSFHYLGEALYEIEGTHALPQCDNSYGFGCYHGFLLAAIDTQGYAIVPELDAACIQRHGQSMDTETCQHGIGHGLLEFSRHNPLQALAGCDLVADVYPQLGCASGVFMEYFNPTQSDKRTDAAQIPTFDAENPFNICSQLGGTRLATCLFEIQSWWQDVPQLAPTEVEALCSSVADTQAREFCFIGYGNFKGPYVEAALPYCDAFVDPANHALCRAGILWAAEHHYDSNNPGIVCSDLEPEHEATCFAKGRFTCEVEGNCMN